MIWSKEARTRWPRAEALGRIARVLPSCAAAAARDLTRAPTMRLHRFAVVNQSVAPRDFTFAGRPRLAAMGRLLAAKQRGRRPAAPPHGVEAGRLRCGDRPLAGRDGQGRALGRSAGLREPTAPRWLPAVESSAATNNAAGYLARYPAGVDLGCLLAFRRSDGGFLWQ